MITKPATMQQFETIIKQLRAPQGCPWDREQTHQSLTHYLIEETYELVEAIDENNAEKIQEELGDLLLHVVMHSTIAEEQKEFTLTDVIETIMQKMIRRHPHVFKGVEIDSLDDIWKSWDAIKKQEKGHDGSVSNSLLKGIPKQLPALLRAEKIQRRASRSGFDWNHISGAWDKVMEEINEVKEAEQSQNHEKLVEEIGDLLFSIVNVARKLEVDPEQALQFSTQKFMQRFEYIEDQLRTINKKVEDASCAELDTLWTAAKKKKKKLVIEV